jgi:hypothetical protein
MKFYEAYSRPLLAMMWRTIPDLGPSFAKFADGLKQHAESQHGGGSDR